MCQTNPLLCLALFTSGFSIVLLLVLYLSALVLRFMIRRLSFFRERYHQLGYTYMYILVHHVVHDTKASGILRDPFYAGMADCLKDHSDHATNYSLTVSLGMDKNTDAACYADR